MNKKDIGKTIKSLREHMNMTQVDLADKLDINQSTFCRLEQGAFEPRLSLSRRIATAFGLTLQQFENEILNINHKERPIEINIQLRGHITHDKLNELLCQVDAQLMEDDDGMPNSTGGYSMECKPEDQEDYSWTSGQEGSR